MSWRLALALYVGATLLAALTIDRLFGQVLAAMLAAVALLVTAAAIHDALEARRRARELSRPHVVDLSTITTRRGPARTTGRHGRRKARKGRA